MLVMDFIEDALSSRSEGCLGIGVDGGGCVGDALGGAGEDLS